MLGLVAISGLFIWKWVPGPDLEISSEPMVGYQLSAETLIEGSLQLPSANRELAEGPVPITGPWVIASTHEGVRAWEAPLPVRPRTLFFNRPPDDMTVLQRTDPSQSGWKTAQKLAHRPGGPKAKQAGTWSFTAHTVQVRRELDEGPPSAGEYAVRYSKATERENSLNLAFSGLNDTEFIFRSLQVHDTTRAGIFLPAPASARFKVQLPEGAALEFDSVLIPPEASDPAIQSDGATIRVTVIADGQSEEVLTVEPQLGQADKHQIDLSQWGGQNVELQIDTESGDSSDLDYVFLANPVVYRPTSQPQRLAIIFIDTLRPDNMSLYGAERQTTPLIDQWAETAAVFENARSIAPWTLPSSRTLFTGQIPERWSTSTPIQTHLASMGWATSFVAGNVYLSSNFEMAEGWGEHRCINWPQAEVQVDRALDFIKKNPNRDAFVTLHLMDMHLPYTEPREFKGMYAGERPDGLSKDDFLRNDVVKANLDEDGRQYVVDRYDQNLAYVDTQVSRFLDALPEDATVVIMSDHGEEFWDHGGFEHGHTLYDELLRIPMVVRGPGITAGRFSEPVSILDVTPTLGVAAGLQLDDWLGWPLQELADGSRKTEFANRPHAFGRPLYGLRRWGALSGSEKYTIHEGKERLYDLETDPDENDNLLLDEYRTGPAIEAMAAALEVPVKPGFRVAPPKKMTSKSSLTITVQLPAGIEHIVIGDDPLNSSTVRVILENESKESVTMESDERVWSLTDSPQSQYTTVKMTWRGGKSGTREVFIVPAGDLGQAAESLTMTAQQAGEKSESASSDLPHGPAPMDGRGLEVARISIQNKLVKLTHSVIPIPSTDETGIDGQDQELKAELEALGYME